MIYFWYGILWYTHVYIYIYYTHHGTPPIEGNIQRQPPVGNTMDAQVQIIHYVLQSRREGAREREREREKRERENIMTFLTPVIINPYQPATKVSFPLTSSNHLQIQSELWISRLRQVAPATLPPPVGVDSPCRAVTKNIFETNKTLVVSSLKCLCQHFFGTIKIQILPWSWQWLLLLRTSN